MWGGERGVGAREKRGREVYGRREEEGAENGRNRRKLRNTSQYFE